MQWTHISTSAIQIWWHTPPFHYKHQDGGEKIWLHQGTNYSVHEHLVLTTDKSYTTIHAQSCQPDTERYSASSCHVCWDAVFCTYFVVIVDWNKFVWIKVLFLENHISYLLHLSRTGMHFGDTWNKCPTLCLYIISIIFDVLADHRKNLRIQMCRVELQVGLSIS